MPRISDDAFANIRRRMLLDCCKWDPQVGDVSTLAPFALSISPQTWTQLATWAKAMTLEATAAEAELLRSSHLHDRLALPRAVRRALRSAGKPTPAAARTIRYDFHWTTTGWKISEANTDVPGGFTEASSFTQLMAEQYGGAQPTGDPAAAWAASLARHCREVPAVALLSAPGFMEDQQIMAYLHTLLLARGVQSHPARPDQLRWHEGRASLHTAWYAGPLGAIVRFYQGEWIARLPARIGWEHLFTAGLTPVANPGSALLTESKRFPLVWDQLRSDLSTWRTLLPETRDPRAVDRSDDSWLFKTAFCNTGDTVSSRLFLNDKQWRGVRRHLWWRPGHWIAQRRFDSIPIPTPIGPMHLCLGVYTVDGHAAGAYGRLASNPVIDFAAIDVPILLHPEAP